MSTRFLMQPKPSPVPPGQGAPATTTTTTPQDMNNINQPRATASVPNPPSSGAAPTPLPGTGLPVGQTHPGMPGGMMANIQPAAVAAGGRLVQPGFSLAPPPMLPPAPGQPLLLGPGAPGQPQMPGSRGKAGAPAGHPLAFLTPRGGPPGMVLPPGVTPPPPGTTLMRDAKGNFFFVPHNHLAQLQAKASQMVHPNIHPRPATPTARPGPGPGGPYQPILVRPPPPHLGLVPGMVAGKHHHPVPAAAAAHAHPHPKPGGDPKDVAFRDDDINDVASMAGVNLNEENAQAMATSAELVGTKIRSCKDESFLSAAALQRRVLQIARAFGVSDVSAEVLSCVSHATQSRLASLLERLSAAARHRADSRWHRVGDGEGSASAAAAADGEGKLYEPAEDVGAQLRFFKQLETAEKQREEEREREHLRRVAKSRARLEDPQQACLKQKAREIQQQEIAIIQQRHANLAALDAIGPRRKRKANSPPPPETPNAADAETTTQGQCSSLTDAKKPSKKPRKQVTRVNLQDFIFCMEQETPRSLVLYKALIGKRHTPREPVQC